MTSAELKNTLKNSIVKHLTYSLGKDASHATIYDWRISISMAVRDLMVDPWFAATRATYAGDYKRVYYLSMEFLIGRLLEDAVINLGLQDAAVQAFKELGQDYNDVLANEPDAALGNGGLGRLAACFLDSMSTLGCPGMGYGIRYEHGLFRQSFEGGRQVEEPEDWLRQDHAWEFKRPEAAFEIGFGGWIEEQGTQAIWHHSESVQAQAFDTPTIGWKGKWANTLRLWAAQPTKWFDLESFNRGDYAAAAEPEEAARAISRVLYPDDTSEAGKELRLKQEYFFTAASLRDLVRRFETNHKDFRDLPNKVAIQLNDTHPAIAGPELVRILHDTYNMEFADAVATARGCLSYTNHTLLPEALERWSTELMGRLLPRHMQIIERIDDLDAKTHPNRKTSIVEVGDVKMGELSFVMAHKVNGVSALHTDLMKQTVFKDLHEQHPDRIVNETNGVTPRRWLLSCNPHLSDLITANIGEEWITDLEKLRGLESHFDDASFLSDYAKVKRKNKVDLANWIVETQGISIDPDAMFDVQIKRIHEYKRQHLNIVETIALWQEIRDNPNGNWTPRVKIFGGKAAPGYVFAKEIIHLINAVAEFMNSDPITNKFLKVVYIPNYNVTVAERLIPASDLSEQISTAGKEASGTGNMKFALNGALTIGTLDGANVEIRDHVGAENFFLFGMTADEVVERRKQPAHAAMAMAENAHLARAVAMIGSPLFSPDEGALFRSIAENISGPDYFLVASDFADYWRAQREVDAAFEDKTNWMRTAALNTARSGWFSSDRTIRGYMSDIWSVRSVSTGPELAGGTHSTAKGA